MAKQNHLRLLRLELFADAHSRSSRRAGNSFRLARAVDFERAVSSRLRALAMSKVALAVDDDVCAEASQRRRARISTTRDESAI
jgi:hypothetical protein